MAKPSKGYKTPTPLDPKRRQGHDLKDPRAQPSCWPCLGKHEPSVTGSNARGSWAKRAVCALKIEYVPRQGSPASSVVHKGHTFAQKALEMLQAKIPKGAKPTYEMVEKTYEYMEALDKIRAMKAKVSSLEIETQAMLSSLQLLHTGSKKTAKTSEAENLLAHLTPEELQHVKNLASQRQLGPGSALNDSLQPNLADGRRCGGCRHSQGDQPGDPPELDESLGTSAPELQIELDTKKVQFSATSTEVHEFDATALTCQEIRS